MCFIYFSNCFSYRYWDICKISQMKLLYFSAQLNRINHVTVTKDHYCCEQSVIQSCQVLNLSSFICDIQPRRFRKNQAHQNFLHWLLERCSALNDCLYSFQYHWDNVSQRLFKYYSYVNRQRIFHWLLSEWYFSARGRIT